MPATLKFLRRTSVLVTLLFATAASSFAAPDPNHPFGEKFPELDSLATGDWWNHKPPTRQPAPPSLDVPRDQVVAFALYTQDRGVLKLSAQLFPLKPEETREVRLELRSGQRWVETAKTNVIYPGWSAHFRIENWVGTKDVAYRVRHGTSASFEGLIRRDPAGRNELVVAILSCNSSRTVGSREEIVNNLKKQNPDLLFFAGDQTYRHTEHTAGWIEWGMQFLDVIRDRPTITIPDDHDVGHGNLWGESGKASSLAGAADGGYTYPVDYVKMVERCQTWHLPDPFDATPVQRGIGVYYTSLRVGEIDFAILEDRKFKSGPAGKIPRMGPRPDHINDERYNPKAIDLPGLELLGQRQLRFLREWGQDWTGAEIKCVLSQTAFAGAVHLHGQKNNRLLADLDCNGWPQTGRRLALEEIRRVWAPHLCGDQHLAVVLKHGISEFGDGPFNFTSPAIVNTVYGRWWWPKDERPGPNALPQSPLPWTGDYLDGLGNKITMMAYANPGNIKDEKERGDGYGVARFNKSKRTVTFECWPRFASVSDGDKAQFPGWPITVNLRDNDGRKPVAWLPELLMKGAKNPVVQVTEDKSGELLYTIRIQGDRFQPPVYAPGNYTIKIGRDKPDAVTFAGVAAKEKSAAGRKTVRF